MDDLYHFSLLKQSLILSPEKALFWEQEKTLVVSDVHLGKSGHFRKHGIAVPQQVNSGNLERLSLLINQTRPDRLIFLGDLFHSEYNREWNEFVRWRWNYNELSIWLTTGNHDILNRQQYESLNLVLIEQLIHPPFLFRHEPVTDLFEDGLYPVCGHIHPAVKLKGKGRQRVTLPCFYFSDTHALLPAFGNFTGTHKIKPGKHSNVFAVSEGEILAFQKSF